MWTLTGKVDLSRKKSWTLLNLADFCCFKKKKKAYILYMDQNKSNFYKKCLGLCLISSRKWAKQGDTGGLGVL